MKIKITLSVLLLACLAPLTTFANAEMVQIVSFKWDEDAQRLQAVSFGSGTALAKDTVLTNKHVVKVGGEVADFLLLCPAQAQESRAVKCDVPAAVAVIHSTLDVALVKTLDPEDYLPSVRTSTAIRSKDEIVRIVGFPVPDTNSADNFGGTKTVEAIEAWQDDPKKGLNLKGDSPTTTRGKVIARYRTEPDNALYTYTDAKVNFGNSGGAAFDQFEAFIGIPTLKDSEGNSFILEYAQIHDWVEERSDRGARPADGAYEYFQSLEKPQKATVSNASTRTSSRYRYFQQLAEQRASGSTTSRYTTTRAYNSPYRRYSYGSRD